MVKPLALVVDDDVAARNALCSFLKNEQVDAAEVGDGVEAVDFVRAASPDIAFLDLQLPRLDGLSVLKIAKELRPYLDVVMMSGLASPQDILAAMEYGAYTFLQKPCDFGLLEKIVRRILAQRLPAGAPLAYLVSDPETGAAPAGEDSAPATEGGNKMAIVRWSPFRDLLAVQHEVNRLFDDLMVRRAESGEAPMWIPPADISETSNDIIVKLEVAGVTKDDIKIAVSNNVLTVKGEKKMEREEKEENYHRVERVYGSFLRTLELPAAVAADKVKASYKEGVLVITLPKTEEVKTREIPIES